MLVDNLPALWRAGFVEVLSFLMLVDNLPAFFWGVAEKD